MSLGALFGEPECKHEWCCKKCNKKSIYVQPNVKDINSIIRLKIEIGELKNQLKRVNKLEETLNNFIKENKIIWEEWA